MDGMGEEIQNGEGIGRCHCTEVEGDDTKRGKGFRNGRCRESSGRSPESDSGSIDLPSPPLLGPFIGATLPARLRPPI